MSKILLHTPDGVRDIYGKECSDRKYIISKLHDKLESFGYSSIETCVSLVYERCINPGEYKYRPVNKNNPFPSAVVGIGQFVHFCLCWYTPFSTPLHVSHVILRVKRGLGVSEAVVAITAFTTVLGH